MSTRIMPQFELLVPQSVDEAVKDLAQYKEKAAVLAGGTDLMIMMKDENKWGYVLSLAEIPDLDYVKFDPKEGLRIGAMARLNQVLASPVVKQRYRALWKAADRSGSPQTRAMATVVGNILRASRTGDCNIAILALGGTVVLRSAEGIREVVVDDFWVSQGVSVRRPDEIAVEVKLPALSENSVSSFANVARTTLDVSKVNAAVRLDMEGGICKHARVAMGAEGPTPIRLPRTEKMLEGVAITDEVLLSVEKSVPTEVTPKDGRTSAEYRRDVSGVLVKRAIQDACNIL